MTNDAPLKTKVEITLTVPVPVEGADGKAAERSTLTMRRPKLRHAKRLAALVGKDLLSALLDGNATDVVEGTAEGRAFVAEIIGKLLSADRLDELTAIIADMCNEDVALIDDLDPLDIIKVAAAFGDFFPALRSAALSLSPATSQLALAGSPTS